jgi:5-methylcytosine-specific restriction protein B
MNKKALLFYIKSYKTFILAGHEKDLEKWEALLNFQENWNIEAEDFAAMYDSSLKASSEILWESSHYHPKQTMLKFIAINQEDVRSLFLALYDESMDLYNRLEAFVTSCDSMLSCLNDKIAKPSKKPKHYHKCIQAISQYLYFQFPQRYFPYNLREFKDFSSVFFDSTLEDGSSTIDKYIAFTGQASDIRSLLRCDEDLINIYDKWLKTNGFIDPEYTLLTFDFISHTVRAIKNLKPSNKKIWIYSPGNQSIYWEEMFLSNIIAVEWGDASNINCCETKDDIAECITDCKNDSQIQVLTQDKECFDFINTIQVGDIIYVKVGEETIIAKGRVVGEYKYDASRKFFKNTRKVDWDFNEKWNISSKILGHYHYHLSFEINSSTKQLTEITMYPKLVKQLEWSINAQLPQNDISHWCLQVNSRILDVTSCKIAEKQTYLCYDKNGEKHKEYKYLAQMQKGDLVLICEATLVKQVVSLYKVSKALQYIYREGEVIEIEKVCNFVNPILYTTLENVVELKKCEAIINNTGNLFKLTLLEYEIIKKLIDEVQPPAIGYYKTYSLKDCAFSISKDIKVVKSWCDSIKRKKQAIFIGPPGTGKTFTSEHIAKHLVGGTNGFYEIIQFHPSYTYNNFIQGLQTKVGKNGSIYQELTPGRFISFCNRAKQVLDICVLVIDEINRADIVSVFGELLYLLENRDQEVFLADGTIFSIPSNVVILGTMNSADSSKSKFDLALLRRFAFIELTIDYQLLRRHLFYKDEILLSNFLDLLSEINTRIGNKDYYLGHAYFLQEGIDCVIEQVWRMEIEPYLEKYFIAKPYVMKDYRWESVKARVLFNLNTSLCIW